MRSTTWPATCRPGAATAPPGTLARAARWLHGAAWNTPATLDEIHQPRGRHLLGASRGVGVRLVRHYAGQRAATAGELAAALTGWVRGLASRDRPLRHRRGPGRRAVTGRWRTSAPCRGQAPGNPAMASPVNRSLNPSSGSLSSGTNSTPRIGVVSAPAAMSPTVPPVRRASNVMCTTPAGRWSQTTAGGPARRPARSPPSSPAPAPRPASRRLPASRRAATTAGRRRRPGRAGGYGRPR